MSPRPELLGAEQPSAETDPSGESTAGTAVPISDIWNAEIAPGRQVPTGQSLVFSTTLRTRDYFKISLINGLLNIITLTLYRFWGKTEVRRRVWRSVRVNGEAFEYTGRGKELFLGFLLASLLLGVPFLGFVFAVQFLDQGFSLLLLPLYLFGFWLWGFGMFTAYRYMASRTTWRGIRFVLFGSAPTFGFLWLGMQIANGMTMGWIQPVFERLLAEQVWNHMKFGDRPFRWNQARSEGVGLYGPFAMGWFGTLFLIVAAFVGLGLLIAANHETFGGLLTHLTSQSETGGGDGAGEIAPEVLVVLAVYGLLLLLLPFIALAWSPYHAAVLRSITAGISLDDASFDLTAGALSLWWLTCTNIIILVLSLGLLMPLIQARTAKYLARRLRSTGTAQLDAAHQAPPGPRTAEGLADAFGFSLI
ncbi:MAG: DUF898 family protein [Caulobacterales bacterium]|nr:DUF898 family protein [Caulobacterales bacterium]